jgi:hypothetical protein
VYAPARAWGWGRGKTADLVLYISDRDIFEVFLVLPAYNPVITPSQKYCSGSALANRGKALHNRRMTTAEVASADTLLAEMAAAGRRRGDSGEVVPVGAKPPKMRYSHQAMVDTLLENPWMSQNQLAAHFGRSPSWISTIVTCDAFQALLAERREELIDPELKLRMEERFRALTAQSLRVLQEKLSKPADQVPDNLALRAAELGAKALGIGGNAPAPVIVTSEERLANLAHRLIALRGGQTQEVVDV